MDSQIQKTTVDVLDEMVRLAEERVAPREGVTRLKRRASMKVDVLWERESVTGGVHYDALLRVPGWGAVSVGYCPDRGLPWALRGSFRASEVDMLRVNDRRMRVDEVVTQLDFVWTEAKVAKRIVDAALIWEAIDEDPDAFAPSDEEMQEAMDAFRRRRGLFTAEATMRWLEQQGMTQRSLESRVDGHVRARKLRRRVTAGREESYFEAHKADFDAAVIARIDAAEIGRARALCDRLRAGEVDVLGAAAEALRGRRKEASRWGEPIPLLSRVRRFELPPERAAVVFAAAPGAVLDPFVSEAGCEVQVVQHIEPAALDAETLAAVADRLFAEWLSQRRAAADVEWLWGSSSHVAT